MDRYQLGFVNAWISVFRNSNDYILNSYNPREEYKQKAWPQYRGEFDTNSQSAGCDFAYIRSKNNIVTYQFNKKLFAYPKC